MGPEINELLPLPLGGDPRIVLRFAHSEASEAAGRAAGESAFGARESAAGAAGSRHWGLSVRAGALQLR